MEAIPLTTTSLGRTVLDMVLEGTRPLLRGLPVRSYALSAIFSPFGGAHDYYYHKYTQGNPPGGDGGVANTGGNVGGGAGPYYKYTQGNPPGGYGGASGGYGVPYTGGNAYSGYGVPYTSGSAYSESSPRGFRYSCTINKNEKDAGYSCAIYSRASKKVGVSCKCHKQLGKID